jgi:hypothetical protein
VLVRGNAGDMRDDEDIVPGNGEVKLDDIGAVTDGLWLRGFRRWRSKEVALGGIPEALILHTQE